MHRDEQALEQQTLAPCVSTPRKACEKRQRISCRRRSSDLAMAATVCSSWRQHSCACAVVVRPHLRAHCPEQSCLLSAVRMGCTFSGASSVTWKQRSVKLDTEAEPKKQAECTYLSVTEDSLRNALASFLLDASPCCLASLLAIPITCDHCVSVAMSSPMTTERQRCELEGSVIATAAHLLACGFGCITLRRAFTSQNFACFFQKCSLSPLHHQQRQVSTTPSEHINISL